ncbi:zinc ribbon domain-containing protein [Neptunomonas phycophila]|jgi:putative FmdB family regulatory protein|uniref:Zinc ribbon domain-containing protein n=1 Tax=Neptunomonas phycophila TaxID=1572645 RepID=A0ABT9EY63_9GAMM|nr:MULTISPECIES: zinc ribbon domain-containing protein [Neptunomonas]MDN2661568.1 zinc ribbon domain-containing protein [Neptunomonas sp. CHC150]MDP2523966.1 zinc ribbon domain-containing protein [Neptunomonas phycophila]
MPMYEYKCAKHGVFEELATLEDYDQPCACPQCGQISARVLTLPPEFLNMLKEKREAIERNEKAQHAPEIMTMAQHKEKKAEEAARHAHKHGSNCGCQPKKKSNLFYTAEGNKMFPSMRPWMISH